MLRVGRPVCNVCKSWPIVARSSLAARREERGSSTWSNIARSFAAGRASKLGSSNIGGAGGATGGDVSLRIDALRLGSPAGSLVFWGFWVAEKGFFLGAFTFFGGVCLFISSPPFF